MPKINDFGISEEDHCDTWIDDYEKPSYVRWWLLLNRLPASLQIVAKDHLKPWPELYASQRGSRVRVTMASRLGDVGINTNLKAEHGYSNRVLLKELSDFGDKP
jgi:hypothetical protein